MRERGLKYNCGGFGNCSFLVAPLAGAWIEILSVSRLLLAEKVAPLAGAWIEIQMKADAEAQKAVAPLAGAWIEIRTLPQRTLQSLLSLPLRERGLKSII